MLKDDRENLTATGSLTSVSSSVRYYSIYSLVHNYNVAIEFSFLKSNFVHETGFLICDSIISL